MIALITNGIYRQSASLFTANFVRLSASKIASDCLRSYPSQPIAMDRLKSRNFHIFSAGPLWRFDGYTTLKRKLDAVHQHELASKIDPKKRELLIEYIAASFGSWSVSNVREIDKEILRILNQDNDLQLTPKEKCDLFRALYCILCKDLPQGR